MRVRTKISLGYLVILTLLIAQGVLAIYFVNQTRIDVVDSVEGDFYSGLEYNRISVRAQEIRRYEKEYFIYVDQLDKRRRYYDEWLFAVDALKKTIAEIADNHDLIWPQAEVKQAKNWLDALESYVSGFKAVAREAEAGNVTDPQVANSMIFEAKEKFRPVLEGADATGQSNYEAAEHSLDEIADGFFLLNIVILAIIGTGIFIGIFFIALLPRLFTQPIEQLTDAATRMSLGDLGQRITASQATGEFRQLAEVLERMRISQRVLIDRD